MIGKLLVALTAVAALAGCGPGQETSQHDAPVNSGAVTGSVAAAAAGANCAAATGCTTTEGWLGSAASLSTADGSDSTEAGEAGPDMTGELVSMAQSTNVGERVSAIGQLLAGGREGDAAVREMLRAALTDNDPRVRAQAISSYARREGEGAYAALQEALHDSDASVRQMAVGGANTKALLELAVNDREASIRQLAQKKLEALMTTDDVQQ
jgi:hypothetical protein